MKDVFGNNNDFPVGLKRFIRPILCREHQKIRDWRVVSPKIEKFLALENPQTPCLVVDLDVVSQKFIRFKTAFSQTEIFYAVKANPASAILRKLVNLGSRFDAASLGEINRCLEAGAEPKHISYGNTIKKFEDIASAHSQGVRLFAFDSEGDLKKLAIAAPGAKVVCRIQVPNAGALWPLSEKFGCSVAMAGELLTKAKQSGLQAYGVSFHVGSQQTCTDQWELAIARAALIFRNLLETGIQLKAINLGGGFPVRYQNEVPEVEQLSALIQKMITKHFRHQLPTVMVEPGRYIIAEAGLLRSEVVLVSKKSHRVEERWIYLDVGKFGGLAETMGEAIQYPIRALSDGTQKGPVIIAGPSCDGADILYRKTKYQLPMSLKSGDYIDVLCAGAYTASYSSVGFNGFSPLREYYL